jgi:dimethylargininase
MKSYFKALYSCTIVSIFTSLYAYTATPADFPSYQYALVRDLSDSFEDSLKLHPPAIPIDLHLAKQQHENYIELLEGLIPKVIRLEADPNHPDCNFIEDTAIIVDDIAVISRMGAFERRGEEIPVAQALKAIGVRNILCLQSPGTMDGGDILYTGKHLFVGLSKRTNEYALDQLKKIFQNKIEVIGIPVTEGLHLKSVISFFDSQTLIIADTPAGRNIQRDIELSTNNDYRFVAVPDSIVSNVLRIGSTLIVQEGFSASETILQDLCNQKLVTLIKINMSEIIKADGALTCGSLLGNID